VCSKANIGQLNLLHGNQQLKVEKTEKVESKKRVCSEVLVNSPGNPWSQSEEEKKGCGGKDLQKRF